MAIDPRGRMYRAIQSGDAAEVKKVMEMIDASTRSTFSAGWLHDAVRTPHIQVIDALLDAGIDINIDSKGTTTESTPPLERAVSSGNIEVVRHVLSRGADVDLGRQLISAINVATNMHLSDSDRTLWAFELVKTLVEAGVDVNRWWYFGDPRKKIIVNGLSWALAKNETEIAEYLRAHGAEMPPKEPPPPPDGVEEEVIAYFRKHFGPVHPLAAVEIVPSGMPIAVHVIPPAKDRNYITLFTTGMSSECLTVPEEYKDYEFAELFIQLPGDWPERDFSKIRFSWPVHWLKMAAQHPHDEDSWLFPVSILDEGPGELITPDAKFTAMLVMAERKFVSKEGFPVQLYRLTPIYPEERELERTQGVDALMKAFDKQNVPFIVDFCRKNVAMK